MCLGVFWSANWTPWLLGESRLALWTANQESLTSPVTAREIWSTCGSGVKIYGSDSSATGAAAGMHATPATATTTARRPGSGHESPAIAAAWRAPGRHRAAVRARARALHRLRERPDGALELGRTTDPASIEGCGEASDCNGPAICDAGGLSDSSTPTRQEILLYALGWRTNVKVRSALRCDRRA